jgi:predicted ATPase/DNA-binding CsgD family transcriptional regulator
VDPAQSRLTPRGQEVAKLVALGLSNREIAQRLFLSLRTVEWHVLQVLNKLGFSSRSQIAAWVGHTEAGGQVQVPGARLRGNLPAELTSFVGRARELAALRELMAINRLLTLSGAGGTGKTRLALHLAAKLQPGYPDGAWLCELASVGDGGLVSDAVATAVKARAKGGDHLEAAREHLRERSLLLVLDNCEHLLEPSAAVARELLQAAPGLQILATSRAPLGLPGEAVWQLEPLELPPRGRPLEEAAACESVQLFTARARAAAPTLSLEGANLEAAVLICQRLEGIPLALELAAPRLRLLSPAEVAVAAHEMARKGNAGDRHGSLDALVDWSYQLLVPEEQTLFRKLAVFAGWFDVDDAAAVVGSNIESVQPLLDSVAEQSLLVVDTGWRWGTRYRLLDLVRAFARARLAAAGEVEATQMALARRMTRLAAVYQRLAAEAVDDRVPPKMASQIDDVRSALATLLEKDPEQAAMLTTDINGLWLGSNRMTEHMKWSTAAVAANPKPSRGRCWALFGLALSHFNTERVEEGERWLEESIRLAERPECADLRNIVLLGPSAAQAHRGQYEEALKTWRQGLDRFMLAGDLHYSALCLGSMTTLALVLGRPVEALGFAERSLEIRRGVRDPRLWMSLRAVALAHIKLGQHALALPLLREALERTRQQEEMQAMSNAMLLLAFLAGDGGDVERGLLLHHFVVAWREESGLSSERFLPDVYEAPKRWAAQIGEDRDAQIASESRALTIDSAVELALSIS